MGRPSLWESIGENATGAETAVGPLPSGLQQCMATSRSGRRCSRLTIGDETFCVKHGGDLAAAEGDIRRRLIALQEDALSAMEELFMDGDDKTKATLAVAVLDRTGLGPKSTIVTERPKEIDLSGLSMEELADGMDALAERAREIQRESRLTDLRPNEAMGTPANRDDGDQGNSKQIH